MAPLIRDRYEPLAVVGQGGEAQVVKAFDHQLERVVAMKIRLVPEGARRDEILREARILVDVPPNPHLPLVREDFFDDVSRYVVVMDWVEGTDLSVLLKSQGRPGLAPSNVLRWMADAASALTHLHTQPTPVVHGDVKPANLILSSGDGSCWSTSLSSSPNVPGTPGGTVGYVAPEVAAGGTPSRASDIYALAATGWALLTGEPPSGALPDWSGIDPDVAEDMEAALGRAAQHIRLAGRGLGELVQAAPRRLGFRCRRVSSPSAFRTSRPRPRREHHPGAMGRALLRHDELIATAVESHGGRFLKSMGGGDSTFSVFDSATQATHAAAKLRGSGRGAVAGRLDDPRAVRPAHRRGRATRSRLLRPSRCPRRTPASTGRWRSSSSPHTAKLVERSLPATSSSSTSGRTGFAASIRRRTYSPSTARGSTPSTDVGVPLPRTAAVRGRGSRPVLRAGGRRADDAGRSWRPAGCLRSSARQVAASRRCYAPVGGRHARGAAFPASPAPCSSRRELVLP